MSCPDFDDLSAYTDGELTPAEHQRVAEHLPLCQECRATVARIGAMRRQLQALPSPALGIDLAQRFSPAAPQKRTARGFRPAWMPAGLSLAALATGAWLGAALVGGAAASAAPMQVVRVFDPVPPGGLCAVRELCPLPKGMP